MAKQYVGARYVPVVYKNPDDNSASWKANVEYEPLTIVVASNGDSYTSKKAVPKSVGAPQDNPEYWVKTGDFNASLLALQGRMTRAEQDIDNLEAQNGSETLQTESQTLSGAINELHAQNGNEELNTVSQTLSGAINELDAEVDNLNVRCGVKKVMFVGDSYGTASYGNWAEQMANLMHLDASHRFLVTEYGVGFKTDNSQGGTSNGFLRIIQGAISAMNASDKHDLSHVFIFGGFNDWTEGTGASAINNGVRDVANYIRSNCPNAEIYISFIGTIVKGYYSGLCKLKWLIYTEHAYQTAAFYRNIHYMNTVKYGMMLPITTVLVGDSGLFKDDGIHPNTNGGLMIAEQAVLEFYGASCAYTMPIYNATDYPSNKITFTFEDDSTLDVPITYRVQGTKLVVGLDWTYINTLSIATTGVAEKQVATGTLPRSVFFNEGHLKHVGTVARFTANGAAMVDLEIEFNGSNVKLIVGVPFTGNDTLYALAVNRCEFEFDLYDK